MRILARYVLREFLTPVIYCLVGFSSIFLVIELFGEFEKILLARPPGTVILEYLGGYLAETLPWLVPAALLLGGLYAMWQLARHSEITAMRATGIGFATITAPVLWAAAGFAVLLAVNSEFYAPAASFRTRQIKENRFMPVQRQAIYQDVPYNNYAERRDWRITQMNFTDQTTGPLQITWTDADDQPVKVLKAERAEYLDGGWWFYAPVFTEHQLVGTLTHTVQRPVAAEVITLPELTERPRDFYLEIIQTAEDRESLSLRDMIRYVKTRSKLGRDYKVGWRYDIYNRIVSPWACLVVTLFAIPAGVATGRQSVFIGVVTAVGLFFAYYALTLICGGLARKDVIPVGVGVLLPNLLFLAVGLVLFHRQR